MDYMGPLIKAAAKDGLTPVLSSNGKTIRTEMCNTCGRRKQITLQDAKGKHVRKACPHILTAD